MDGENEPRRNNEITHLEFNRILALKERDQS